VFFNLHCTHLLLNHNACRYDFPLSDVVLEEAPLMDKIDKMQRL
jgi:hypothetical protein